MTTPPKGGGPLRLFLLDQREIGRDVVRHMAQFCVVVAMTAPKSGGQFLATGAKHFIETTIGEDLAALERLAGAGRLAHRYKPTHALQSTVGTAAHDPSADPPYPGVYTTSQP